VGVEVGAGVGVGLGELVGLGEAVKKVGVGEEVLDGCLGDARQRRGQEGLQGAVVAATWTGTGVPRACRTRKLSARVVWVRRSLE
jgi:hypothetical protein